MPQLANIQLKLVWEKPDTSCALGNIPATNWAQRMKANYLSLAELQSTHQ